MRTRFLLLMVALAWATPGAAQPAVPEPLPSRPLAWIDLGVRASSIDGDPARFQRYRDLGDGAFFDVFRWERARPEWMASVAADHVGREDQRYFGEFERFGRMKISFEWDQIPLLISRDTRTLFTTDSGGVLRIDDAIQRGIQGGAFSILNVIDRSASLETSNRRDWAKFNLVLTPNRDTDVSFAIQSAKRDGNMPWGASFGFNHAVEVPVPIDTRTTDVRAGVEWANQRGMFRVGYDGSWFDNAVETLVWDNPIKFTDSTYANAYVAGDGTSQGRLALWPSSTMHTVSSLGSIKLPRRSRLTGNIAVGTWRQDAALLPHTINSAIPAIPLERNTAEGEARTLAATFTFTSRPNNYVWLNARYRYYDFDNRTPHFAMTQKVRFDQVVEPGGSPEPFDIARQNFDVDVSFSPATYSSIKIGYGRGLSDRTFRIFEETTEDTIRASFDVTGNQYVSVRTLYEFTTREGEGFEPELLAAVGEQPGMRHYDVANRDRNRVTTIVTLTPIPELGVNGSIAAGKDDYKESLFGLRDNDHRVYSVGFDLVPRNEVAFGTAYTYEHYTAFQASRQANPGVQFDDPSRNWSTDSDDKAHTVTSGFDLLKLIPNTEIRVGYDYSRAKSVYVYGLAGTVERTLPTGSPLSPTLPAPQQLPPVTSEFRRGTLDTRYYFTRQLAIGVTYWYDRYAVEDFALGNERISLNDLPGGILLGYMYRPYTAHTGWLRVIYSW